MIIRRVEVQNFRKLVSPVVIDGLQPGLTVIVGDNEEGKSTLLRALRSAFFDRHNLTGEYADSFQPYNSTVRPEITVYFDLNGASYALRKAFCQRPEAELRTSTGVLTGPSVEEKLQEILRFSAPGRGASKEEHQGIWGLFWVEQGKAFTPLNQNDRSRATLRTALESEVGEVLGGQRGRRILARIEEQHSKFFTSTGKARGEYGDAIKVCEKLEEELTATETKLRNYEGKVDQLQRDRDHLFKHQQDSSLENAKTGLRKAEEADRELQKLERAMKESQDAVTLAEAEFKLAVANLDKRQREIEAVSSNDNEVKELKAQITAQEVIVEPLAALVDREAEAEQSANQSLESANQHFKGTETALRIAQLEDVIARRKLQLEKARIAKVEADNSKAKAEAIDIDPKKLGKLKKLDRDASNAEAQVAAVATRIEIVLEKGRTATVAGENLLSPSNLLLKERTRIEIPECAQIDIVPGGDIATLRATAKEAYDDLQKALQELRASTVAVAETRLDERNSLLSVAQTQRTIVEAHAPEGLDTLEEELAGDEATLAEQKRLTSLNFSSEVEARNAFEAAQEKCSRAQSIWDASRKELEESRNNLNEANNEFSNLKGQYRIAVNRAEAATQQLEKARLEKSDSTLQDAVVNARQKLEEARTSEIATRLALDRAEPERVRLQLDAARDGIEQIDKAIRNLERSLHDLQIELRALGQFGLGEEKERLEQELAAARNQDAPVPWGETTS
jgi:chromosome segregation ATPase